MPERYCQSPLNSLTGVPCGKPAHNYVPIRTGINGELQALEKVWLCPEHADAMGEMAV